MKRISLLVILMLVVLPVEGRAKNKLATTPPDAVIPSVPVTGHRQIIVISDLHMGVGKDEAAIGWDNTEDFRWPLQFGRFLEKIDRDGNGNTDLIIAGDLFELWQSREQDCQVGREEDFGCTEDEFLDRLNRVIVAHKSELAALGVFARNNNNRLIILPGNHDAALLFPKVRDAALGAIGGGPKVVFFPNGYWLSEDGFIYVEHGHQIGREVNKWKNWPTPFLEKEGKRYLQRPWGEKFVQDYYNRFEIDYPIIDNFTDAWVSIEYARAAEGSGKTMQDMIGFLKFYFFQVSWEQLTASLGKEKEGFPPEWDIKAIRSQGPDFLAESLPSNNPLASVIRESAGDREKEQLAELFKSLTDEEINTICNKRAFILAKNEENKVAATVASCPRTAGSLGAVMQSITKNDKKVLGDHMEKDLCPVLPGCMQNPFSVFIYGHTHVRIHPSKPLSLRNGNWKPSFVNSGAWQRVATPKEVNDIRDRKSLPKEDVLTGLFPEDLSACYTYLLIKPYETKEELVPILRYWVGEEGKEGVTKGHCR
jgi:UDP-2,3-diacylglucosamine pyrophosphatase LpxH